MIRLPRKLILTGMIAGLGLLGGRAEAGFTATFVSQVGGTFNYSLGYSDGADEQLLPYAGVIPDTTPPTADAGGGLITIYDFDFGTNDPNASVTIGGTAAGMFSFSTQLSGINPIGAGPVDNAAVTNVTFYYTGPTRDADFTFTGISLTSSLTDSASGLFASQTTRPSDSTLIIQQGSVTVAGVPEPASMVLVGLGGLGAFGLFRRRRAQG